MPHKKAKERKRKRINTNKELKRNGRTPSQIERKKRKENAKKTIWYNGTYWTVYNKWWFLLYINDISINITCVQYDKVLHIRVI